MEFLKPVTRAFGDVRLQILAQPTVFFLLWLILTLAPQLLMGYLTRDILNLAMEELLLLMTAGTEIINLPQESVSTISRGLVVILIMLAVMAGLSIYHGAVLSGVVAKFRNRDIPKLKTAFRDGWESFPRLFQTTMFAVLRIMLLTIPGYLIGIVIGVMIGDPFFAPITITGIFFIIGFLHYGLAPFIHLALGLNGRDAVRLSRIYYRTHKQLVSWLFITTLVFPMIIISTLSNLMLRSPSSADVGFIVLGVIQSIAFFVAALVYINFGKNSFIPDETEVSPSNDS